MVMQARSETVELVTLSVPHDMTDRLPVDTYIYISPWAAATA
jgi:hypothetical protein